MSAATGESARAPRSTPRILVVDDQPANLRSLGSLLGGAGYEIVPAADGPTALKRVALRPPDLVLLDLLMPGMDGCEVCRRLRLNPAWQDLPVIFLSAVDDKELIVRALEAGGVDYLTKPVNTAELMCRVRTHLALKTASDRLKQLAEDKDELLGILAHDLKNHLGGMRMSAEMLGRRPCLAGDPRARQLADNILASSSQLLDFVNGFLANIAADRGVAIVPVTTDLAGATRAAVGRYEEAARLKSQRIELTGASDPLPVSADPSALGQVLDNLVSNALKFSPAGGTIRVSLTADAFFGVCRVADEGPGVSDEDRARLFRRYARLSARPTAGEPSTGLGLSIARRLMEGMGGEIACENAEGGGAAFTVRLPRAEA